MRRAAMSILFAAVLLVPGCGDGILQPPVEFLRFSTTTSGVAPGSVPFSWDYGCAAIDPSWLQGTRVTAPVGGLVENGFTFTTDGTLLNWVSAGHILEAVFVYGGGATNMYYYNGAALASDAGLSAPRVGGAAPAIEHYEYCYLQGTLPPADPPTDPPGDPGSVFGCGAGYWLNMKGSWPAYAEATLGDVFTGLPAELAGASFRDALRFGGGRGLDGALRRLMQAASAGLLSASADFGYPRTAAAIIADAQAAIDGGERGAILTLAEALDADNNGACPLDAHGGITE
jgi:hypothetical protein